MTYQDNVISHLGSYKKNVLNIHEKGIFPYNGQDLYYDHILPKNHRQLNILELYRDGFYKSKYSKIDYHRYFHHLNSSQALCINLFYPLIAENKLDIFFNLIRTEHSGILNIEFEFVSDLEKAVRKTHFDLFILLLDGTRIYVEVKYTEQKFGSAKMDQAHIDKFEDTYQPLLLENPFIREKFKTRDQFLANYQVMRNLVHLGETDYVVFLYPQANKRVHHQSTRALNEILTPEGSKKFRNILLEEMSKYIKDNTKNENLKTHYSDFKRKYLV